MTRSGRPYKILVRASLFLVNVIQTFCRSELKAEVFGHSDKTLSFMLWWWVLVGGLTDRDCSSNDLVSINLEIYCK